MSIFGERRHERQIDVYMRINESGEDPLSCRIDYLRTRWNREIRANPRDRLILNVYLGFVASIRSYDFAVHELIDPYYQNLLVPLFNRCEYPGFLCGRIPVARFSA